MAAYHGKLESPVTLTRVSSKVPLVRDPTTSRESSENGLLSRLAWQSPLPLAMSTPRFSLQHEDSLLENSTSRGDLASWRRYTKKVAELLEKVYGDLLLVAVPNQGFHLYKTTHFKDLLSWVVPSGVTFAASPLVCIRVTDETPYKSENFTKDACQHTFHLHPTLMVYAVVNKTTCTSPDEADRTVWIWSVKINPSSGDDGETTDTTLTTLFVPPTAQNRTECLLHAPVFSLDTTLSSAGLVTVIFRHGEVSLYNAELNKCLGTIDSATGANQFGDITQDSGVSNVLWSRMLDLTAVESYFVSPELSIQASTLIMVLRQSPSQVQTGQATLALYTVTMDPAQLKFIGSTSVSLFGGSSPLNATYFPTSPLDITFTDETGYLHILSPLGVWHTYQLVLDSSFTPTLALVSDPLALNQFGPWVNQYFADQQGTSPFTVATGSCNQGRYLTSVGNGYVAMLGGAPHSPAAQLDQIASRGIDGSNAKSHQLTVTLWDVVYRTLHDERPLDITPQEDTSATHKINESPMVQVLPLANQQLALAVSYLEKKKQPKSKLGKSSSAPNHATSKGMQGGELTWNTSVTLCSFYTPIPNVMMNIGLRNRMARYTLDTDPLNQLMGLPDANRLLTKRAAETGPPQHGSWFECNVQAELPALDESIAGIQQTMQQKWAEQSAHERELINDLLDTAEVNDSTIFTTRFFEMIGKEQQGESATGFDPSTIKPFPRTFFPREAEPKFLYHMAAADVTWAHRQELAEVLEEPFKGRNIRTFHKRDASNYMRDFPELTSIPSCPNFPSRVLYAAWGRCLGHALHPEDSKMLLRCVQAESANPLPLTVVSGLGDWEAYETNAVRIQEEGKTSSVQRLENYPSKGMTQKDFWPRLLVAYLIKQQTISSGFLEHRLIPYLLKRREWRLIRLAFIYIPDIPLEHAILALQHRLHYEAERFSEMQRTAVNSEAMEASDDADSALHRIVNSQNKTFSQFIAYLVDNNDMSLYLTTILSFVPVHRSGRNNNVCQRLLAPEDVVVLANVLTTYWSMRSVLELVTGTLYGDDTVIKGRIPALSDVLAFLNHLMDAHFMLFVTHPELWHVERTLRRLTATRLRLLDGYAKHVKPWKFAFDRASSLIAKHLPDYQDKLVKMQQTAKLGYTFHLPINMVHSAVAPLVYDRAPIPELKLPTLGRPLGSPWLRKYFPGIDSLSPGSNPQTRSRAKIWTSLPPLYKEAIAGYWTEASLCQVRYEQRTERKHVLRLVEDNYLESCVTKSLNFGSSKVPKEHFKPDLVTSMMAIDDIVYRLDTLKW
ncbi:hypothetical protein IWQ62_003654 [Dispira parvispora]|uniref:Uncharacterized protein n=1 Tax=Dispira parvispora TaxID=1520584 RepID=A0A9W8ATS6_9FUNG|nr:hypothetical protein IWQ62_003654 [Dispira parvispora]